MWVQMIVRAVGAGRHGEAYTYAEFDRMCLEAGFKATDLKPLAPTLQSW